MYEGVFAGTGGRLSLLEDCCSNLFLMSPKLLFFGVSLCCSSGAGLLGISKWVLPLFGLAPPNEGVFGFSGDSGLLTSGGGGLFS